MTQPSIRLVTAQDLPLLDKALQSLSKDLGDAHPSDISLLQQAMSGPTPAFHAVIATEAADTVCGAVVFSPVLSTTLAATGLYVSDLWVAEPTRGTGLGRRLLAQAANVAETLWGAKFLKLVVYDGAPEARQFYDRLGFTARTRETTLLLDKSGLDALKGQV